MVSWWQGILGALWLFLPGFVANMSPVVTSKMFPKWTTPIDFGSEHRDGRRTLGNGKTWRGLVLGGVAGGLTALIQSYFHAGFLDSQFDFGLSGTSHWAMFLFGAVMGWGALIGDVVESYFKRRKGLPRGAMWFPFDQLDFVVFGLLIPLLFFPLAGSWAITNYVNLWTLGTLIIGTPALHLTVNYVGYKLKLKEVPW